MPWIRLFWIEIISCSVSFLDLRIQFFGKFLIICLNRHSVPFALSSSVIFGILILLFLMESESSYRVLSFLFNSQVSLPAESFLDFCL